MSKISVIIPTMNRIDSLSRTFTYLENSTCLPDEVIVVDQTQDKVLAAQIDSLCKNTLLNAKYKWNCEPSLTKARNSGYALAKGDIIVFMDDDVDVKPDTFAHIHRLFKDETIAMAGGINELDNLAQQSMLGVLLGRSSYRKRGIGHVAKSVYGRFPLHCKEVTPSEWAMGFFFVVRKCLMDQWNIRFDEHLHYYAYAEDLDFTYGYFKLAQKVGLKCIFSSLLTVRHNVSTEYRIPTRKQTYMVVLHRRYLCAKHKMGLSSKIACAWSDFGDAVFRALHKQSYRDVLSALYFYLKHWGDIQKGEFHYNNFMQ